MCPEMGISDCLVASSLHTRVLVLTTLLDVSTALESRVWGEVMSLVTPAIKDEIKDLVCEIIDVEPFVVTPMRPFQEYREARNPSDPGDSRDA